MNEKSKMKLNIKKFLFIKLSNNQNLNFLIMNKELKKNEIWNIIFKEKYNIIY